MAVAAVSAVVAATAAAAVAGDPTPDLVPIATAVGEAWADELVQRLHENDREIIGAWPGTLSEARMRVLARLHVRIGLDILDNLARVAAVAARREWQQLTKPDPEP